MLSIDVWSEKRDERTKSEMSNCGKLFTKLKSVYSNNI